MLLVLIAGVTAWSISAQGFSNSLPESKLSDATSCGTAGADGYGCHGPRDRSVTILFEGDRNAKVNSQTEFRLTIIGGPAKKFGYYILVEDSDGQSRDAAQKPLFNYTPITHAAPTDNNTLLFQMLTPRYSTVLKVKIAVNSVNGDGAQMGDAWNSFTATIDVKLPEHTPRSLVFYSVSSVLMFVILSSFAFLTYKEWVYGKGRVKEVDGE